jgi:hypothetical protein
MRNLRVSRRGDDMPLYGKITRVGKARYEVIIKFVASKRVLHHEQLRLPNKEAVQRFYEREFPTLTWGEPKYPKARVKLPASERSIRKRVSKLKEKKVTRKSKPAKPKRKKKANEQERLQRTGAATRHCQADIHRR